MSAVELLALPPETRQWLETRSSEEGFATPDQFLLGLIEREREEDDLELRFREELVAEALASGPPEEVTPEWWAKFRADMKRQIEEQTGCAAE